jgi:hypothetical protein
VGEARGGTGGGGARHHHSSYNGLMGALMAEEDVEVRVRFVWWRRRGKSGDIGDCRRLRGGMEPTIGGGAMGDEAAGAPSRPRMTDRVGGVES